MWYGKYGLLPVLLHFEYASFGKREGKEILKKYCENLERHQN